MKSVTSIVTLDNFTSKMPPWDPNLSNHLYAIVDMGRCVHRFDRVAALVIPYYLLAVS